jgi:hypothetical protein
MTEMWTQAAFATPGWFLHTVRARWTSSGSPYFWIIISASKGGKNLGPPLSIRPPTRPVTVGRSLRRC